MPTQPRKNLLGFIDPISIIGVLFLIVTLAIGTVVTTNKDSSLNIAEKAGGNCGYCNGKTCISCGGGRIDLGDCTSNAQCGGSVCGDGQCQSGETAQNCASDCGSSDTPRCGDGNCNGRETPGNCSIDCDSEPPVCQPNCSGKSCGDNGCGGSCGTCSSGLSCVNNNCTFVTPTCQRNCTGKTCGDDGCGSSCGTCSSGLTCINNSCTFVTPTNSPYTCQPNCSGKTCGDDGCGGNCGTCGSGLSCQYGSCTYVTPTNSPYCQRNCTGKTCGDDGCGGNCGTCGSGLSCQYGSCTYVTPTNSPACTPNCTNKCGGSNGCGGTCSNSCPSGLSCVNNSCTFVTPPNGTNPTPKAPVATPPNITNNSTCGGTCQSNETCVLIGYGYYGCQANGTITQCTPNCTNKCGGSNGCGGTCSNNCAAGLSCVNNSCTFVTPTNGTNPTPIAYGMDEDFRVNRVDDTAQNIVTPPAQYSFCNGKSSQCNSTLSFFDSLIPDSYISYWQGQTGNQAVNFNNLVLATYKMVTPDFIANPILEKLGLRDEADSYLDIAFNQQTTLDTADLITFDKTSRYVSNYQRINEQTYDPNSNGVVNYLNSFNAGIRDKETLASTIDLGVTLTTEAYALTVAAPLALTSGGIIPGAVSLMGQAQVVSTVMQTGGTASYCALNGWDEICQQQAARTALSWTTIGVSQYSNSASTALSRVANTVVSGANLAVDSADAVTAFSDPNADTLTKAMSLIAVVGDVGGGIADFNQGQLGFGGADLKVIKNDITDMLSTNNIAPNNLPKVADIPKDIPLVEIPVTPKVVADAGNADLPVVKPADVPKADVPVVERITNWVEDMTGNKKVTEAEKILNQTDLNVKSDYDGITKRFTENAPYEPKASAKTPASDLETTVLQKIKNISSPEELPTFKTAVLDNSYAKTPISTDIIKAQTLEEAKAILAREGVDLQIVDDDFLPGNAEAWAPTVKKIFVSESASNDWVVLKSSLAHETTHIDMLRTGDQILAEIGTGSYLGDAPISNAIRNVGQEDWAYVNGAKAALNELENNPNLTQAQKDLLQKKVDDSMKFYNWVVYGDVRPPVTTPPSLIAKVQGQVEDAWNNLTGKDSVPETTFYPKGDPDLEGSVVKVNPDRTIEVQSNMFENHTFVKIKDGDNIPGLPDSQVILVGDNYYVIFKERITQLDNTNSIVVPLNSNPPKKPLLEYVGLVDPNSKALDIAVDDYMSKSLKYVPSNEETIEILIKNGYRPQDINPDVLTDFRNKVISKIQSPSNLSTAQVDEAIKKTPLSRVQQQVEGFIEKGKATIQDNFVTNKSPETTKIKLSELDDFEIINLKPGDKITSGHKTSIIPNPDDYPDGLFYQVNKNPKAKMTDNGISFNKAENYNRDVITFFDSKGNQIRGLSKDLSTTYDYVDLTYVYETNVKRAVVPVNFKTEKTGSINVGDISNNIKTILTKATPAEIYSTYGIATAGLYIAFEEITNRDTIREFANSFTQKGVYSPTMDEYIFYKDGNWYIADTGELITDKINNSYISSFDIREDFSIASFIRTQHLTVTESSFKSETWKELKDNIQTETSSRPNDINDITIAIKRNLIYDPRRSDIPLDEDQTSVVINQFNSFKNTFLGMGAYFFGDKYFENVLENNATICFDFAIAEATYLAEMNIPSKLMTGNVDGDFDKGHALLVVTDKNGQDWAVDPTWGDVSKLEDYIKDYRLMDVQITEDTIYGFTNPDLTPDFTIKP